MANILLVQPDSGYNKIGFSLTLAAIGGVLKEHHHQVNYKILDLPWNHEWQPGNDISEINWVGITVTSIDFSQAIDICTWIKTVNPKLPVIAGGAHATFAPDSLLKKGFDICVRGEGEYTVGWRMPWSIINHIWDQ